jgi:transposase-like protein
MSRISRYPSLFTPIATSSDTRYWTRRQIGCHWRWIRTNNPLERILREIRPRTRVVELNIELLKDQQMRGAITA